LLLTIAILLCAISYSQDFPKLKLTPNGVEPIIVNTDSLKATDLYEKALNWVQETYKNPEKVLKAKIENEKIRIDAFAENAWWYKSLGMKQNYNMAYSVEISFKDGKYKFEYIIGQFFIEGGQKVLYDYKTFYKKTGEVRSAYTDAVPSLEETMNNLSLNFYNYLTGKTTKKDDKW
ncbi:DUF4468 domain-containing protein, partial [Flavobacterium sp. UBA6046]